MNTPMTRAATRLFCQPHVGVHVCGLVSLGAWVLLARQSHGYASATLWDVWLTCGFAAAMGLGLWWHLTRRDLSIPIGALLCWALAFRVAGLWAIPPLEDDFYRYLWDGRMMALTGDPYSTAPAAFFADLSLSARFEEILGLINYPQVTTVYGPACQWFFALAYVIAPGEVWPLQLMFMAMDMLLIGLLLRVAPTNLVLLYAWCPLVVFSFAFSAHTDILGMTLLLAALMATRRSAFVPGGMLFALALGSKLFAILLFPWVLGLRWRAWMACVLTLALITASMGSVTPWLPGGLNVMATQWLFNAPLLITLLELGTGWWPARLLAASLFITIWCGLLWSSYKADDIDGFVATPARLPRGDLILALFLLTAPALNPWYWPWVLMFAVIYPSRWAWTGSVTLFMAYGIGLNLDNPGNPSSPDTTGGYDLPAWLLAAEFGLILFAALLDWRRRRQPPPAVKG